MDKVINFGIPHVGELIFESINTPGLIKCLLVSETWKVLAENVLLKRWNGRLFPACNRGYIEVVKLLLKRSDNIDLNARNIHGQTAFIRSCAHGQRRIAQLLLSHPNIEVNARDNNGWTALKSAYTNNQNDVVKLLLDYSDKKIDLNARYDSGRTVFMQACQYGHKDMVKLFLDHSERIDLNVRDFIGTTAFMLACLNGHKYVVKLLLDHSERIDLNARNYDYGKTAFMLACDKGYTDVVQILLDHSNSNIDLNTRDSYGTTAFMSACLKGHKNVVQLFLSSRHWGAAAPKTVKRRRMLQNNSNPRIEVNAKNNDGSTAFIIACKRGHKDIVELLLECSEIDGIDVSGYKDLPQEMKGFIDSYLLKLSQF